MNNAAGITRTKFGSEAVMKSEAAPRISETPFLRAEVPLVNAEMGPLPSVCQKKNCEKRNRSHGGVFLSRQGEMACFFWAIKEKNIPLQSL